MFRILFIVILFASTTNLKIFAQNLTVFNSNNTGLPKDELNTIVKDYEDNLWIGVSNIGSPIGGLIKYRDSVFTIYNKYNSALSFDQVSTIAVDTDNSLWIGVFPKGVYHFKNGQFQYFDSQNSLLTEREVSHIFIDNQGNKWFTLGSIFAGDGIVKFDGLNWTTINSSNSELPTNNAGGIIQDSSGVYWIGLRSEHEGTIEGGGLVRYDGSTFQIFNKTNSSIPSNNIEALTYHNNNLWLNTLDSGIVKFDGTYFTSYTIENYFPDIYYKKIIYADDNSRIWVETYCLDGDSTKSIHSMLGEIYHIDDCIYFENKMWVLGYGGIYIGDELNWKILGSRNTGISTSNKYCINLDKNNNLVLGTGRSFIIRENNIWKHFNEENTPIPFYPDVHSTYFDDNYRTYLGTDYGLWIRDQNNWTNYNDQNSGLPYNSVKDIQKDSNDVIWIATNGLAKFIEPNLWTVYNTTNSILTSNDVAKIIIDSKNRMWAVLRDPNSYGGIVLIDENTWSLFNNTTPGISTNFFYSIAEDPGGNIWAGAQDGFYKFDGINWQKPGGILSDIDSVRVIRFNPQGEMYFVSGWLNFYKLTKNNQLIHFSINHPEITNKLFQDVILSNNDKIYLLTFGDIIVLEEDSTTSVESENIYLVEDFSLDQNFPNPFNPTTTINYSIVKQSNVSIVIYDILGNEVAKLLDEEKPIGNYSIKFNADKLSSGIYFYRLQAGEFVEVKKMMLIK